MQANNFLLASICQSKHAELLEGNKWPASFLLKYTQDFLQEDVLVVSRVEKPEYFPSHFDKHIFERKSNSSFSRTKGWAT